ncbi:hypothetical protein [Sphingobacterium sp. E70]|uniref:hypothetical protein n=1 Tax=Sphingobacterium sp. E70 TaxID=2853439 RepID=UPI00359CB3FD
MRYIVDRTGETRTLELEGEAYFEVAHQYRTKGKEKYCCPLSCIPQVRPSRC